MTVKELIVKLQGMAPEAEVHIGYAYGDYARTIAMPAVRKVGYDYVIWSDLLRMYKESDSDEAREVVVLR